MNEIKLSTPVNIKKPSRLFSYDAVITGIGSCFAQYVMEHLEELGFGIAFNPNGIVYNAASIAKSLDYIVNSKSYDDDDHQQSILNCQPQTANGKQPSANFIHHNNLWHSWEHHGAFSNADKRVLQKEIDTASAIFREKLAKSNLFILTPSSSVIYRLKSTDSIVANCHKYPEKNFNKEILSPTENFNALTECIKSIKNINSNCHIVITLSPVRHYPGDLVLNARSKANLLSAIHQCIDEFDNVEYFPSYEILLDELRDYRFFKEDMLHPTDLARKIIFQKFASTYFTPETQKAILAKEKELKTTQHKPFNSLH